MKDYLGYLKRLENGMSEKLFFIEHIDLNNKIIIDFGCASGSLLVHLKNLDLQNTTLIGIEQNERFLMEAKKRLPNDYIFNELSKSLFYKNYFDNRQVVIIFSSVMHELNKKTIRKVCKFAKKYADYIVVRDMYWNKKSKCDFKGIMAKSKDCDRYLQHSDIYGDSFKSQVHWLLKYTYVENWETELVENYFGTPWKNLKSWVM